MRFVRKSVLMANDMTSNDHVIGNVAFGPGGVTIDVEHMTGTTPGLPNLRVGQARYLVANTDLDWSLGDPSEAALAWLISLRGPLVDGQICDVDPLEIARQEKLAAVAKASEALIAQAKRAAEDMIQRATDAADIDALDQITPDTLNQGTTNDG